MMAEIEMNIQRNNILERKLGIYSFLLLSLAQHEYRFPDLDEEDERQTFCLSFSENALIRKCSLVERPVGRVVIKVFLSSGCFAYQTSLAADETSVPLYCSSLGYENGFRSFSSEVEVLEECLRLENAMTETAVDLAKTTGECSVCFEQGEVLMWPCHESHIVCVDCTSKIIHRKSSCPLCRTLLKTITTVCQKVEVEEDVEDDKESQLWDGDDLNSYIDEDDFYVRLPKK